MKKLVVYYSMHGNSELVAEAISRVTGADILRIEPVKAYPDKGAKKFIWGGKSAVMGETPKLKPYIFDEDKYEIYHNEANKLMENLERDIPKLLKMEKFFTKVFY